MKYTKHSRRASAIAKALECYRMASDEKRANCDKRNCPYNNNDPEHGYWCCYSHILYEAVRKLTDQEAEIKKLRRAIDYVWTGERKVKRNGH